MGQLQKLLKLVQKQIILFQSLFIEIYSFQILINHIIIKHTF
jgi:hypothetical protein